MSRRSYSEINLHFVWHVKSSLPIITSEIEPRPYRYIRSYSLQSSGLIFHEIGGTETHIHIAVTIPPTLLISDWIGKLKGASSHHVNHKLVNRKLLDWQSGLWRGEFWHQGSGVGGKLHSQPERASQEGHHR